MALPPRASGPLAVLQHRNYRLLWAGQVCSMIGTRMQGAALLWHLWELTHSYAAVGAIGAARVIPLMLFALVGGTVADSVDRRRLMLVSQLLLAVLAALLGWWARSAPQDGSPWPIYAVAALSATTMAFDGPARQSLLPSLVPREFLANAVSLGSLSSQLASIVGPTLAGIVIARSGSVAPVYFANAVSFGAVIAALLALRLPAKAVTADRPRVRWQAVREGLRFIVRSRLLWSLMLLDFGATFFASANALIPAYAQTILHVGPEGYGLLQAAPSVGSLIAAGVMSVLPPRPRPGRTVLWAVAWYGIATIAFGLSRSLLLSLIALAGTGAADTVSTVLRQTIRQLATPDALRGRMTAISMLFFQGGPQLGEIEAGLVARCFGPVFAVVSGGVACVLTVVGVAIWAPWVRQYRGEEEPAK